MSNKLHPLFEQHPLYEERQISTGMVPIPYQTYDGNGLFIGGTADFSSIQHLLKAENVNAMQTTSGKAVMGIWVVDFTEASLGPHNELQFSILVSHQPSDPIEDHPLTLLKALFMNPKARMFCYGLWNNTPQVVAYNRELLGLPAALNEGKIEMPDGRKRFHFQDENGQLLIEGDVSRQKRSSLSIGWSLARLMGLSQSLKAASAPYLEARVVNPIGEHIKKNLDAKSFLAADSPVVQMFDRQQDSITLNPTYQETLQFKPQFLEHFSPFRFVYLLPGDIE